MDDFVTGREVTMNPSPVSVFDLSPSEKLQLVEDLWDVWRRCPKKFLCTTGRRKNWRGGRLTS
jgi:hypothetical protein